MKQELENSTPAVQTTATATYEAPHVEVIEMETEGPILQMSGDNGGQGTW